MKKLLTIILLSIMFATLGYSEKVETELVYLKGGYKVDDTNTPPTDVRKL